MSGFALKIKGQKFKIKKTHPNTRFLPIFSTNNDFKEQNFRIQEKKLKSTPVFTLSFSANVFSPKIWANNLNFIKVYFNQVTRFIASFSFARTAESEYGLVFDTFFLNCDTDLSFNVSCHGIQFIAAGQLLAQSWLFARSWFQFRNKWIEKKKTDKAKWK